MKGFRTLTLNLAATILPAMQAADFTDVLDAQGMAIYSTVLAVLNIVLRCFTTTPVMKQF